jgi:L-alanine-DL-glutamate epimerase-like enolase superfamily enzyme
VLRQPVYSLIGGPARAHTTRYATSGDADWRRGLGFRMTKLSPHAVYRHTADVLQSDVAWAGDLAALPRISAFADAAGMPILLHADKNIPYGRLFGSAMPVSPMGEIIVDTAPGVLLSETHPFPVMAWRATVSRFRAARLASASA